MKKQGILNKVYWIHWAAAAFIAMNPGIARAQESPIPTHDIPVDSHEVTGGVGVGVTSHTDPVVEARLEYTGPHGRVAGRVGADMNRGNPTAGSIAEAHIPLCSSGSTRKASMCFTIGASGQLNWVEDGRTSAIGTIGAGALAFISPRSRMAFELALVALYGRDSSVGSAMEALRFGGAVHVPIRIVAGNVRFEANLGLGLVPSISETSDGDRPLNTVFFGDAGLHYQMATFDDGAMGLNLGLLASCIATTGEGSSRPDCRAMAMLTLAGDVTPNVNRDSRVADVDRDEVRLTEEEEDRAYIEARRDAEEDRDEEDRPAVGYRSGGRYSGYSDGSTD